MRNCDVAAAWQCGEVAASGHMHTDGLRLWSYGLIIGNTNDYGRKVVFDYTGSCKPNHFVSMTTSCHVGLAKQVADQVEEPSPHWRRSG